jgi:hypothetical protein
VHFPLLSSSQQTTLLELASAQGYLSAGQIPEHASTTDRARQFIAESMHGSVRKLLGTCQFEAVSIIDAALDGWQRDAVTRAIGTPDICLIQGGPGTGKSRVVAEIVRQAVRRGQRVLLTAPHAAALDVVLERLADDEMVFSLRCLSRDEQPERLSPSSAARTFDAHRTRLTESATARARQTLDELAAQLARGRSELPALEQLHGLCEKRKELESQFGQACQAPSESDPFARDLAEAQAQHEIHLHQIEESERTAAAELQSIQKQIVDLESAWAANQQAATHRGWLSKLLHISGSRDSVAEQLHRAEVEELRLTEGKCKLKVEQAAIERQQIVQKWEAERQRRLDEQSAQRQSECESRRAELAGELTQIKTDIDRLLADYSANHSLPADADPESVCRIAESRRQAISQLEREEAFARRWLDLLTEQGRQLPSRLLRLVNFVAAPVGALTNDDTIAELTRSSRFDLLIVDETDRLSEAELHAAMRRARRWVFVGELTPDPSAPNSDSDERTDREASNRNGRRGANAPSRAGRSGSVRGALWQQLWGQLHSENFCIDSGRLCVRMLPPGDDQQSHLESEAVADSPDIELLIWSPPNRRPALAEVRFGATTSARQALAFLHRELAEIPIGAGALEWEQSDGRLVCGLLKADSRSGTASSPTSELVELEPGLNARIVATERGWRVASIEFDCAGGWDSERAEVWARQSLHVADLGRTACLPTLHRANSGVATFTGSLGIGKIVPSSHNSDLNLAVEFIPVPELADEPQARRRGDVGISSQQRRLPPLRGGAGFEIDLSDSRQRDQLSADIRAIMPDRGFVNLSEAEAIVRLVQNLIDDLPASGPDRPESIAVLSVYDAQTELIRHLLGGAALLANPPLPLHVESACRYRQRESDVVIISLTRSHRHRAVSYGDEVGAVPLALTRARRRLVLVGDPGTLVRRTQWDGPLDHLDEATSRREKEWVAALIRQLQGQGAPTVHLREGPP